MKVEQLLFAVHLIGQFLPQIKHWLYINRTITKKKYKIIYKKCTIVLKLFFMHSERWKSKCLIYLERLYYSLLQPIYAQMIHKKYIIRKYILFTYL